MLKPIDITVLVYVVTVASPDSWTQSQVATGLGVSQSNVHRALQQLQLSGLIRGRQPQLWPLRELVVHAVKHVYPASLGPPTRGLATAHSASGVGDQLASNEVFVWPLDSAATLGTAVEPLHPCVPTAARRNAAFHQFMAMIDVMRVGRVRDHTLVTARLDATLGVQR